MTDALDFAHLPTLADRYEAKALSLNLPPLDLNLKHHFGPGLYIREVTLPVGTYVIGHSHKAPHMCIMLQGQLAIVDENGGHPKVITAPATFIAPAGRKVVYAIEQVVFQNVFATDETDIDKLELMLVDKSPAFLAHEAARLLVSSTSATYPALSPVEVVSP